MTYRPDNTDLKILQLLQENGRTTNLQIATQIGLSPAPTLERVRKLENAGFIKGYHALVDEEKLGLGIKSYLQISIDFQQDNAKDRFLQSISGLTEVTECYHVTGNCNFLLKIYVKDMGEYERLLMDKISKIPSVRSFQTMIVMSTNKKDPTIPLPIDNH